MRKMKTIDLVYAGMFAALMAVGANIAQFLVVGGVPITLQTFFAILAGLLLGSRLGAISLTVYAFVGLAGAPVFAQFTGGPAVLFKPTFGFILSYILVAYVAGKIVESKSKPTMRTFMIASFTGFILNYVLGTNYMYFAYKFWAEAPEGFTYGMAWMWMVAPLPKDVILSIVAALISPRIYSAVTKTAKRAQVA
ncbi:biotin transporter BioY [Alkalihalobacillus hwajinpoensis]|uniref:biotin transporter BioY n=1 Tax=Guptibacillus hwajinpoensis TaxID=208199 RepID=UPI0018841B0F|nr:biotin transporter BioY [Pseudalkalibacillus hwajinpoensis]MBF0708840.1 biotin transporter BioY [Pseudalkalibacillus hwajinpoensis]